MVNSEVKKSGGSSVKQLMSAVVAALLFVATACGSDSETTSSESTEPPSTTVAAGSTADETTTTAAIETTTEASTTTEPPPTTEAPEFIKEADVPYITIDGADVLLNIHTPVTDGPWPVVLNFHGLSSDLKDDGGTNLVAEEAAKAGMIVYTPSWISLPPDLSHNTYGQWVDTANCAVAFAQEHAAANGGDPTKTVLHGFSAGVGPSMFGVFQPSDVPVDGCVSSAIPSPVSGVVLGDGEYFLHSQNFDQAFADSVEEMQVEVRRNVDPSKWPADMSAEFFLWVPKGNLGSETAPRRIADASDESSWLALRDPDGSIRADLSTLNQLDDEIVSNTDAGELLAFRLEAAGMEVTLDRYLGGHNLTNKADELVGYFQEAVAG